MKNWKKYKLLELCSNVTSGGTPLRSNKEFYEGGKIPWLKTKEVINGRIYETENHITELGLVKSSAKLIPSNSVIVAMYGDGETAGRVAINKVPLTTNQACCNLTFNPEKANYEYVFYYLRNSYEFLVNLKVGSGQQNLSAGLIKNIEVEIPDNLSTQSRIATILSSLDDKIELNCRMNQTLEHIAQALFNHYFVDNIDPDNLPEGWKNSSLDKIANYLNGIALQKHRPKNELQFLPIIKIKELKNGLSSSTEKADIDIPEIYVINSGDVLFSWSGSLEVDLWCSGKGALNQHLFKVSSDKYPKWFYYLWTMEHLQGFKNTAASKATTMGHIRRHHLTEAEVFVPPENYLEEKGKSIEPLINLIISNRIENNTLIETRDIILPKLMSGEIDVNTLKK